MAVTIRYQWPGVRGIGLPLAVTAVGALAAFALFGGLPSAMASRAADAREAAPAVSRYSHEVSVTSLTRGCRWEYSADPDVQVANCGDDTDAVRVVFHRGRVTEYRLSARLSGGTVAAAQAPVVAPRNSSAVPVARAGEANQMHAK